MTIAPVSVGVSEPTSTIPRAWLRGSSTPFVGDGFTSLATSFPQISALQRVDYRWMRYFTPHRRLHSVDASGYAAAVRTDTADVAMVKRSILVSVRTGERRMKSANDGG